MESKKNHRVKLMGVRYKTDDFNRLKIKANDVGLDVSTYVRFISLNSISNE